VGQDLGEPGRDPVARYEYRATLEHVRHRVIPVGISVDHLDPDHGGDGIDEPGQLTGSEPGLGVRRVVEHERNRGSGLRDPTQKLHALLFRRRHPVGQHELEGTRSEVAGPADPLQGDLGHRVAGADLERLAGPGTGDREKSADPVEVRFAEGVELASRAVRVHPVQVGGD
jgi:hypothetical protein